MHFIASLFFFLSAFFVVLCLAEQGKPEFHYEEDGNVSSTTMLSMDRSSHKTKVDVDVHETAYISLEKSAPTAGNQQSDGKPTLGKVSHEICAYTVLFRGDVFDDYDNNDLPAIEMMCMCGSSGSGNTFVLQGAIETCMRTCMDGFDGDTCTDGTETRASFTGCCDSCSGNAGFTNALRGSSDWTPWACFEGEVPPLQCSMVVTDQPEHYVDGNSNLLDGIRAMCDCGSFANGVGMIAHDEVLPCFRDCIQEFNGEACVNRDNAFISAEIERCCDLCEGNLGRQSLLLNGIDFRIKPLACGVSFTTPVPTASPSPMDVCNLLVEYKTMGWSVGKVDESCSCPGKEWNVTFGAYGNIGNCFKDMMSQRDGTPCETEGKTIEAAEEICQVSCDGLWFGTNCLQKLS